MTGPRFWQAYRETRPLAEGYAACRPLYQLLWCLEVAWDTPEHQATLQSVLRNLDETL